MAAGMSSTIKRLLEERKLIKAALGQDAVNRELEGSKYDLQRADSSLAGSDYKWATIEGYYSMFHAARALLYSAGYRERSHAALSSAIRELYVKSGRLSKGALDDFENAMDLRQEADYAMAFSEEGARRVVKDAERFLQPATAVLEKSERHRDSSQE